MPLLFSLTLLLPYLAYSNADPAMVRATIRRASVTAKRYTERTRLLALKQRENRRVSDSMKWNSEKFDLISLGPDLMCPFFEFLSTTENEDFFYGNIFNDDTFHDDLLICEIGCNQTQENIVMTCEDTREVCEEAGAFCVKDHRITSIMSFDLESASAEVCMTYTNVPTHSEFKELNDREACISIDGEIDITAAFAETTETDAKDYIDINTCRFAIGVDVCQCTVCDDGVGVNVECPGMRIVAEECADMEETSPTYFNTANSYVNTNDSIIRFTKMESQNSSPSIKGFPFICYAWIVTLTFIVLLN